MIADTAWSRRRAAWLAWFLVTAPLQGRFPFRSPAAIERHQRRQLEAAVHHAYRHVPFYREQMPRLGLLPEDIVSAADLARLPLLDRAAVQADPERFVSDTRPLDRRLLTRTSGSAAAPLSVYNDPFDLIRREAHNQRASAIHRRVTGRPLGCRTLLIGLGFPPERRRVNRLIAAIRRLTRAQTRSISIGDPVERAAEEVQRFRPDIVCSHGSYVESLMIHLHSLGNGTHLPRLALYGADPMSARGRALISEQMGIPVLSVYGAVDAMTIGFECPERAALHLNVDICPVRVIDDAEREVPAGQAGSVVVSNLLSRGSMLLNYRIGDRSSFLADACPCGRNLPQLDFVHDRLHDWLLTPDGERVRPAKAVKALEEDGDAFGFQLRQEDRRDYALDVILNPACDPRIALPRLERALLAQLPAGVRIHLTPVHELPRTRGGKVHAVVGLRPDSA